MQTRRALILVGLSVICNKLDLVTYVGSWIKCPLYFGLSVIRSCLVLVGFPLRSIKLKFLCNRLVQITHPDSHLSSIALPWQLLSLIEIVLLYQIL